MNYVTVQTPEYGEREYLTDEEFFLIDAYHWNAAWAFRNYKLKEQGQLVKLVVTFIRDLQLRDWFEGRKEKRRTKRKNCLNLKN